MIQNSIAPVFQKGENPQYINLQEKQEGGPFYLLQML
jgi:hypothetical protein